MITQWSLFKWRLYHCQYERQNSYADNICAYEFYTNWHNGIHQLHDMIIYVRRQTQIAIYSQFILNKHGMQRIHRGNNTNTFNTRATESNIWLFRYSLASTILMVLGLKYGWSEYDYPNWLQTKLIRTIQLAGVIYNAYIAWCIMVSN